MYRGSEELLITRGQLKNRYFMVFEMLNAVDPISKAK